MEHQEATRPRRAMRRGTAPSTGASAPLTEVNQNPAQVESEASELFSEHVNIPDPDHSPDRTNTTPERGQTTSSQEEEPTGPQPQTPTKTVHRAAQDPSKSANKALKRDTPANPDRAVFPQEDTPQPSRKRRAQRLNAGAMYFTELDRHYLETLTAYRWLTIRQLAQIFKVSRHGAQKHLYPLVEFGLVDDKYRALGSSEILYAPTIRGMKQVDMWDGYTRKSPRVTTYDHTNGLANLALVLQANPANGIPLMESEMVAAARTGKLSPRILRIAPWTAEQFRATDFTLWAPQAPAVSGASGITEVKRPDMLLLHEGQPPTPVELELTVKSNKQDYVRTILTYQEAANRGDLAPRILYVLSDAMPSSANREIEMALTNAKSQTQARIEVAIARLQSTQWKPIAADKQWILPERETTGADR